MELINRQDVIDIIMGDGLYCDTYADKVYSAERIKNIPTVEPKKGKWVLTDYPDEQTYRCSVCNEIWTFIVGTPVDNGAFFCPNCGARMEESEESDGKI